MNEDGAVTAEDAQILLRAAVGLQALAPKMLELGDVMPKPGREGRLAGDGWITVEDAGRVLAFTTGRITYRNLAPEALVKTIAGSGRITLGGGGFADGPGDTARFWSPWNVDVDAEGVVYVADLSNHRIRKIQDGIVSTFAGTGRRGGFDGPALDADFTYPRDVDVDAEGNVYVADGNHTIRKIARDGEVTTLAGSGAVGYRDGKGAEAQFAAPNALVVLPNGDVLVADSGNDCIRRVASDGEVTTWAGHPDRRGFQDGPRLQATFREPDGIAVDLNGNVYIADGQNHAIRKIYPSGMVTTLAGEGQQGVKDGKGLDARFVVPMAVDVDAEGNVYTSDFTQQTIRKIAPDGTVTTLAGVEGKYGLKDGPGSEARFFSPMGVACTPDGVLYIADSDNSRIRRILQYSPRKDLTGLLKDRRRSAESSADLRLIAGFASKGGRNVNYATRVWMGRGSGHVSRTDGYPRARPGFD